MRPQIQDVNNNLLGRKQCEYFNYEDKWGKEIDRLQRELVSYGKFNREIVPTSRRIPVVVNKDLGRR